MPALATLQRIETEDARQFAYRILRLSILKLLLRPGEKLNESELATSLQMSRTPIRDVLARLARENLVELIPQRGAFVARIDPSRVQQAVWVHTQTGIAALEVLYTERTPKSAFTILEQNVAQQELCLALQDVHTGAQLAVEFHEKLYQLANLDLVWSAMHRAGTGFWRLLQLASTHEAFRQSTLLECRCIAQSLVTRDNASACRALQHQFERIHNALPALRAEMPAYFTTESTTQEE